MEGATPDPRQKIARAGRAKGKRSYLAARLNILFNDVDVFPVAHILEDFWPDGGGDLAEVGLFQEQHKGA